MTCQFTENMFAWFVFSPPPQFSWLLKWPQVHQVWHCLPVYKFKYFELEESETFWYKCLNNINFITRMQMSLHKNHTDRWYLFTCVIEQGNVTWKNDLKCSFDCTSSENSWGTVCWLRCWNAGGVKDQCGSMEKMQMQYGLILVLAGAYLNYGFLFNFPVLNTKPLQPSELLETCRGCWEGAALGWDSVISALAPFVPTLSLLGKSLGQDLCKEKSKL